MTAGAEQQDVVRVVVLHFSGEMSTVLVGHDVLPEGGGRRSARTQQNMGKSKDSGSGVGHLM